MRKIAAHTADFPSGGFSHPIEIRLFGGFELSVSGESKPKVPRAVQTLLGLLVLAEQQGAPRVRAAEALWPEVSADRALFYLRRSLTQLRSLLGAERDRLVSDSSGNLCLDLKDCRCDVLEFKALLARYPTAAVKVYSGGFLAGMDSAWIERARHELREDYLKALGDVAEIAEQAGDCAGAAGFWKRLLTEDGLREQTWRSLMKNFARRSDYAGVERLYRDLRRRLDKELGLPPEPETEELHRQLMSNAELIQITAPQESGRPPQSTPLPRPLTSLVGRESDCEKLCKALSEHRIVTLTGPGGVGKTRLAWQVAKTQRLVPEDQILVIELQQSTDVGVSSPFGVNDGTELDPVEAMLAQAGPAPLLLVLDGVEPLVQDCSNVVQELVARAPELTVLCTSRIPLQIDGEYVFRVDPLALPNSAAVSVKDLLESPAVRLFVERARVVSKGFELLDSNSEAIAKICRSLDGLPLALELAAAQIKSISPSEIAVRLDDRFSLLRSNKASDQKRRTLDAALDWSFQQLSTAEKRLFIRLAVFSGSCSLAAVEAVCSADDLPTESVATSLASLVNNSLVEFDQGTHSGRYRLLNTVQAYALEKLCADSNEFESVRLRHASYYLNFVEQALSKHPFWEERLDWGEIESEAANYVAVIQFSSESRKAEAILVALRLVNRLFVYWRKVGRLSEALQLSLIVIQSAGAEPSDDLAETLFRAGGAAHILGKLSLAGQLFQRAEAMAGALDLGWWQAESLKQRGELLANQGHFSEARDLLGRARGAFATLGDELGVANCLCTLGYVARDLGRLPDARKLTEEALAIYARFGSSQGKYWCIGSLGAIYLGLGKYDLAAQMFEEALASHSRGEDRYTQIWNLTMLAEVESRTHDFEKAAAHLKEALLLHAEDGDTLAREWPTSLLGEVLMRMGDLKGAREALEDALTVNRMTGSTKLGGFTMLRLAELQLLMGNTAVAATYLCLAEAAGLSDVSDFMTRLSELRGRLGESAD